jgi:antitoxin YefM
MMSLESYNNLMENIFVRSNHKNYQHIIEGISQLEGGKTVTKTPDEWEKLLNE